MKNYKALGKDGLFPEMLKMEEDGLALNMNEGKSYKLMVDIYFTEPFEGKFGMLQWEILSPLLFVLFIDYIMKNIKSEIGEGIDCVVDGKLFDLDYADDIIFICNGAQEIQRLLNCLAREEQKVGFVINARNSEIISSKSAELLNKRINYKANW